MKTRIKNIVTDISYDKTREFFKNRAKKYDYNNPYSVTMYQDNNPELVKKRNEAEIKILLPKLYLDNNSVVLDIACGIGRWADAIKKNEKIKEYTGIDFSGELIDIANKRNDDINFKFYVGSATQLKNVIESKNISLPNVILMVGLLIYMNDDDVLRLFSELSNILFENSRILIREPIGISDRLTLKNFHSDELNANYNAIYRTKDDLLRLMDSTLFINGFSITEEGFLFDDALKNRKETSQYYYILERKIK